MASIFQIGISRNTKCDNIRSVFVNSYGFVENNINPVNKNTSGIKKVAWPRKTASTTKRTDIMGSWPRSICNHNTPCTIWD